jgi:hypothetical protein
VSTGGTIGQVLTKLSSNDYDTGWIDQIDSTDRLVNGDQQLVLRGNGYLEFPDNSVQTTAWTGLSAAEVTVSAVAPDLAEGALWYNSTDGRTYVKYGALWVDANPPVVPHVSTYLDGLVVEGTGITTLAPDSDITIHDITFTADGRIQLPAGGDIVDSSDRSLLGGAGDRLINGAHTVSLGTDGKLTFPDGFIIDTSTYTNTTMLFGAPNGEISTKNIVLSTGEITNTISIPGTVFDVATGAGNTDPVSISGKNGVSITTGADGLAHTQYHWTFGTDGVLRMPDGGFGNDGRIDFNFEGYNWGRISSHNRQVYIHSVEDNGPNDPNKGNILTELSVGLDVVISTNVNGTGQDAYSWQFGLDGRLRFPDGTIQTTAYNSIYAYTVSATPPQENNLWFNIVDGRMYVNIYDEGTLWVDANPPVVPPVSTYLDGLTVEGTTISTTEIDADITVQNVVFTADGNIQLPAGGHVINSLGARILGGSVVERTVMFPEGAVGDTRGTIALTPAGETYICVADYQTPQENIFTVVNTQEDIGQNLGNNQLTVDLRNYPELLAFILANSELIGDALISSDGGATWIDPSSYTGLSWTFDPPYLGLQFDGDRPGSGQEFLIKFASVIPAIWNRIVDLTANSNEGGYGFNLTAPGDLTLETTRPDGYEEDCDLNLYAADDIWIEAYGDDVTITAANQVRIQSNNADYQYQWTFDEDGVLTVPGNIHGGGAADRLYLGGGGDEGMPSISIPSTISGETDYIWIQNQRGAGIRISTGDNNNWQFNDLGQIQFPDATIQTTAWTGIGVGATAPANNALWYNSTDGRTYLKYNNTWVDANPPVVAPVSTYLSGLTIDEQTISSVDSANPDVKIGGNLLPDSDLTYDLGSATNQWNSLHIKDTTIYMSGRALSLTSEGLKVDGGAAISVLDGGVAATWLLPV